MVTSPRLKRLPSEGKRAYRLVNSKFPPIAVFDDVASAEDFEALFALQSLTNPRILNQIGRLELLERSDIPFGIPGCSYAIAPFTHVNPEGSRFSDGSYGVLYMADDMETAIAEVRHHQHQYWSRVAGLRYERFVFRGLVVQFDEGGVLDALTLSRQHAIYAPADYSASRAFGATARKSGATGLRYHSVRQPGAVCWGLFNPRPVTSVQQSAHYEMIWSGEIAAVHRLSGEIG